MVANKEYALAGKFFEYIFEPVLASHSTLFYGSTSTSLSPRFCTCQRKRVTEMPLTS